MTDKTFAWLDATALRRIAKLDLHHMASGPGGQAMLDMFNKMHKAAEILPWTIVVKDFIRRYTQPRAARQVHVHLDSTVEYGFTLNFRFRGFASRSARGGGSDEEAESPVAAAQGNGGFVRQGTRSAGGPSRPAASPSRRGSLSPVRETRATAASGGNERSTLEEVWTSPEAIQAAVELFGDVRSRHVDEQRVPRGVGAAALELAWHRQTDALRWAVQDAYGYFLRTPCRSWLGP